jgi:plastocyanin
MRIGRIGLLITVVAIASGALTAAALARSGAPGTEYKVFLGEQAPGPVSFKKLPATLNQFMPSRIVIAAGDRVTFSSASFHTVTYTPKPIPLLSRGKGTYEDIVDAAGEPFYFNGLPKLMYNPAAFGPFGPKTISGKTPVSSGALSPQGPKAPPATATYTFPKAGVFKLICTVHVGMTGTVVVKPAGSAVPLTPTQVQAQALADVAKGYAKAKVVHATAKAPANTVYMGVGGKVTTLAYYPKVIKVKAGTTVTFVTKSPSEVHDVVFGPQKWIDKFAKQTDLFPTGPTGPNQASPVIPYGSDPKPYSYTPTMHGNGFFATPIAAGAPIGLPRQSRVTFTEPGTFKYFCWIHGTDMSGTVVVTP